MHLAVHDMQAHVIVLSFQQHVKHDALSMMQVTIRNAGHMVPHDHPLAARAMIETWGGKRAGCSASCQSCPSRVSKVVFSIWSADLFMELLELSCTVVMDLDQGQVCLVGPSAVVCFMSCSA